MTTASASATVSSGHLRGTTADGVARFLGVPYAAAPFGALRFAEPRPHAGWDGDRDATHNGATAPQNPYGGGLERLLPTVRISGDEILTANIWAPAERIDGGAPVLVWIHGGSLSHGSNALPMYDGARFARDGIVFVALNYRLGVEGFTVLDDAPANLGLADVAHGLQWVHDEIAAFGGDPARITVAGQSAGGALVSALLGHPTARHLMRRAVLQSAPLGAADRDKAGRLTRLIASRLGIGTTRAEFAGQGRETLLATLRAVTGKATPLAGGPGFDLVVDEGTVPAPPVDALSRGTANGVELLIGTTRDEHRLWMVPTGLADRIGRIHLTLARLKAGVSRRVVSRYQANRRGSKPSDVLGAVVIDMLLRRPLVRVADARSRRGATTWVYEFTWPSPVDGLGAAHGVELGFVFDLLDVPDYRAMNGPDAPQALADEMHGVWVSFVRGDDPGWPAWDERRQVRIFGPEPGRVEPLPRADEIDVWDR
ncbi:carboxylesterase family protein [Rhodococcus hoagii]|nr:carboxylesterase family protein [Prescottella equi]